ncbi:MAG: M23 family metallopeptidase [Actinomycetota bacterium]|nr:M23 family metallopeptidase [Actinomycetota bacterium]
MSRARTAFGLVVAVLLATPSCGTAGAVRATAGSPSTTTTSTTTTSTTTTTRPVAQPATTTAPAPLPLAPRPVTEQAWTPFATVGPLTLTHPASRVERIGFHQSTHDGAQELTALPSAAPSLTLEDRQRDTGGRTAADVVVDPDTQIRAPVTGRVKRAGTYVLYCKHSDDYVVIEPDDRPGWEVKILHIDGVRVRPGNRVVAGQTVLAPRATPLPFESQVDKVRTVDPAWPHVHIEVVDPSIPDRPSPNPCT